jgi:hypothetical protein
MRAALILLALALLIGLAQLCAPASVNGLTLLAVVLTVWGAFIGICAYERKVDR